MRVGSFSLLVPEGRERSTGHVHIAHGTQYSLRLGNHHHRRCDASVEVDGKQVGTFRLDAGRTVTIERPAHDRGLFTFFRQDSCEAHDAGQGEVSQDRRGLVRVTFRVEKARPPASRLQRVFDDWADRWPMRSVCRHTHQFGTAQTYCDTHAKGGDGAALNAFNYQEREVKTSGGIRLPDSAPSAGVTGLTGHSHQNFTDVAALEYDPSEETRISLRLVCDDGEQVRRLVGRLANPVPVPV